MTISCIMSLRRWSSAVWSAFIAKWIPRTVTSRPSLFQLESFAFNIVQCPRSLSIYKRCRSYFNFMVVNLVKCISPNIRLHTFICIKLVCGVFIFFFNKSYFISRLLRANYEVHKLDYFNRIWYHVRLHAYVKCVRPASDSTHMKHTHIGTWLIYTHSRHTHTHVLLDNLFTA